MENITNNQRTELIKEFAKDYEIILPDGLTAEELAGHIDIYYRELWTEYIIDKKKFLSEIILGPWLVMRKEPGTNPNLPSHAISICNDKESHIKYTEEITGGNIEFLYIPLSVVKAAPELLEALKGTKIALKKVLDDYNPDDPRYEWVGEAHEAILKAEGKIK